jgi:hypothetical protein
VGWVIKIDDTDDEFIHKHRERGIIDTFGCESFGIFFSILMLEVNDKFLNQKKLEECQDGATGHLGVEIYFVAKNSEGKLVLQILTVHFDYLFTISEINSKIVAKAQRVSNRSILKK